MQTVLAADQQFIMSVTENWTQPTNRRRFSVLVRRFVKTLIAADMNNGQRLKNKKGTNWWNVQHMTPLNDSINYSKSQLETIFEVKQ